MKRAPTYTPQEIRKMCLELDIDSIRIMVGLIDEELDLYEAEEMAIIAQASMILFTKSLLLGSVHVLTRSKL